jgi:Na+-driven multidrug efflux pump
MIFLTLGGTLKVILNFLFVAVFDMSVAGVAVATIFSWSLSLSLALVALFRNKGIVRIRLARLRPYKRELLEILKIGVPAGVQQALYSIANVIIGATVNSFGPDATTGKAIADTFDGVLYQISVATSYAVMPYVSQNVGCGNIKRATQAVARGMLITIAMGATFGMLSAGFSWQLSSIMSDNPAVLEYSRQKMIIVSSTYFICGINSILCETLRGMGRPLVSTVATLIFMCGIRFPWVYFVFPLNKNLTFLYLIWPIGWVLSIVMLSCFYFPTVRRLKNSVSAVAQSQSA